jgi:hypothetical protein
MRSWARLRPFTAGLIFIEQEIVDFGKTVKRARKRTKTYNFLSR